MKLLSYLLLFFISIGVVYSQNTFSLDDYTLEWDYNPDTDKLTIDINISERLIIKLYNDNDVKVDSVDSQVKIVHYTKNVTSYPSGTYTVWVFVGDFDAILFLFTKPKKD